MPKRQKKAGLIPYHFDESLGKFKYLMMISSDARYGGDKPMVSKGGVDSGETLEEAAIREAVEELGLIESNIKENSFASLITKSYPNYKLAMFICEVKDSANFGKPCYETEYTRWMTAEEFFSEGRKDHREFIDYLDRFLQISRKT